jgi:hypothetical protein
MTCNKLKLNALGLPNNNFPCDKSNNVSVSDLYSLQNCVKSLSGQGSNSASPTDIYRLNMNNIPSPRDFKYDGEYIPRIFMKVFNTQLCPPFLQTNLENEELLYEYLVYLTKIKNFTTLNICPYFIKVLGGNLMVDFEDIERFLKNVTMIDDITGIILTDNDKTRNLYRNMQYVLRQRGGRPSISNNAGGLPSVPGNIQPGTISPINLVRDVKYGYFMTEGTDNTVTLDDIITSSSTSLNDLYIIIFQLLVACKTMSMSKLAHNDLHTGNVLVERKVFNDTIVTDTRIFSLQTPVRIHIYDFDRGYLEDYKNTILQSVQFASQSNNLIEKRDLVKILAYFFIRQTASIPMPAARFGLSQVDPTFRENIANILIGGNQSPGVKAQTMINFYQSRGVFLQRAPNVGSNSPTDFAIFNRSFDEMLNLSYGLIDGANRNINPLCTPKPGSDIYYIKNSIFDKKGNIIQRELEKIKSNSIKDRCVTELQSLVKQRDKQIIQLNQQIRQKM